MIEITGLRKTFGVGPKAVNALNGVDLKINSGMFGLLGPNGAGAFTEEEGLGNFTIRFSF